MSQDVEWLDDEPGAPAGDEDLPGGDAPPPRRGRLLLGLLAVLVAGAVLIVVGRHDERGDATPSPTDAVRTVTVPSIPRSLQTFAIEVLPSSPPREALAAIRSHFPRAEITGFVAAPSRGSTTGADLSYTVRWRGREIVIDVRPEQASDTELVFRTSNTVRIAQTLGASFVDASLSAPNGSTTARDFSALQSVVQDPRLLATR